MRYITKPNIPDSAPDVTLRDEERGDALEHIKECYEYLESKGIDIPGYDRIDDDDYYCDRTTEGLDGEIRRLELQIKEVEEKERNRPVTIEDLISNIDDIRTILKSVSVKVDSQQTEIDSIKKEMIPQRKIEVIGAKLDSLINTLNAHTQQIADLMRKENENETTS